MQYKQNNVIKFNTPFPGKGKVVGLVASYPYLGNGWIVEILTPIPEYIPYEYTHVVVYDIHITEAV